MARQLLPAIAAVVSFIDCINRGDLDGRTELMTDDQALVVFDQGAARRASSEPAAWDGCYASFPATSSIRVT